MKTILLTTVLILGYLLTVSAQSQSSTPPDTGFMTLKIGKPGISSFRDSLNTKKLNVPFSTRNLYLQVPKDKEIKIGQPAPGNWMSQKGMPVLKPKGSFSMPVYRPDSTIRFSLLIKEYKKLPPNEFK